MLLKGPNTCDLHCNGGQKKLGLCEKPFQAVVMYDPAPKDNFSFGFGFIPSSSPPPPPLPVAMLWPIKGTHFHPFCSKFSFVWGGRGGIASFSNITGKVQKVICF